MWRNFLQCWMIKMGKVLFLSTFSNAMLKVLRKFQQSFKVKTLIQIQLLKFHLIFLPVEKVHSTPWWLALDGLKIQWLTEFMSCEPMYQWRLCMGHAHGLTILTVILSRKRDQMHSLMCRYDDLASCILCLSQCGKSFTYLNISILDNIWSRTPRLCRQEWCFQSTCGKSLPNGRWPLYYVVQNSSWGEGIH